mgnify:FL=1
MVSYTDKYRLPYPNDSDMVDQLPSIMQSQAQAIENCLTGFDFDGQDASGLASRVTSLERLLTSIRDNTVVLFDNDANPFQGAVTLSESAENFEKLEICYKSNDNVYSAVTVANPNNKLVVLTSSYYQNNGSSLYLKSRTVQINGKVINTFEDGNGYHTGEGQVDGSNAAMMVDSVTITQVYGIRRMAII